MYKATRELIKARQHYSDAVIEVVNVKRLGGADARRCYDNACKVIETTPNTFIVSGWIVCKFNTDLRHTEILQHYWNVDSDGNFFDTTEIGDVNAEYVVDSEIGTYIQAHYDEYTSDVCSSLILKENGALVAMDFLQEGTVFREIENLSTPSLFSSLLKKD